MKIKTYTARDMRTALRLVREEQGPDAVILATRTGVQGVEVEVAVDTSAADALQAQRREAAAQAEAAQARRAEARAAQEARLAEVQAAQVAPAKTFADLIASSSDRAAELVEDTVSFSSVK